MSVANVKYRLILSGFGNSSFGKTKLWAIKQKRTFNNRGKSHGIESPHKRIKQRCYYFIDTKISTLGISA